MGTEVDEYLSFRAFSCHSPFHLQYLRLSGRNLRAVTNVTIVSCSVCTFACLLYFQGCSCCWNPFFQRPGASIQIKFHFVQAWKKPKERGDVFLKSNHIDVHLLKVQATVRKKWDFTCWRYPSSYCNDWLLRNKVLCVSDWGNGPVFLLKVSMSDKLI